MSQLAVDAQEALTKILTVMHPQYSQNELYLFGESYVGHYVPAIAHRILSMRGGASPSGLNLVGIGLGDACPGEENSMALPELLHGPGYVDSAEREIMHSLRRRCLGDLSRRDYEAAFRSCEGLEIAKNLFSGGIHDQDSRVYANYSNLTQLDNVDAATSEDYNNVLTNAYLDEPEVRRALHVDGTVVDQRSMVHNERNTTRGLWLGYDNVRSTVRLWPDLVSHYRVMVYNGNFDVSCNHLGIERSMEHLGSLFRDTAAGEAYAKAYHSTERRWFAINGTMAGYYRHVMVRSPGSALIVVAQGGGHLYPHDQPRRMHVLLNRFLRNDTLCDHPTVCRASDVAEQHLRGRCALLYNCSTVEGDVERGKCNNEGACECNPGWTGVDCSFGITPLPNEGVAAFDKTLPPKVWHYHPIKWNGKTSLTIHIETNSSGISVYGVVGSALPSKDVYSASWQLPGNFTGTLDLGSALRPFLKPLSTPEGGGNRENDDRKEIAITVGVANTLDGYGSQNVRYKSYYEAKHATNGGVASQDSVEKVESGR